LTTLHGQTKPFPISHAAIDLQTILLHPQGLPAELPFIALDSGVLEFKFDDLSSAYRTLEIRWKHCTFDWYDSPDLIPSDFIQGFTSLSLNNFEASFNTRVGYTHYSLEFPNDLMRFDKSGNYVLEVVDPSEPETPLIQRRFVVYENLVDIELNVQEAKSIPLKRTHQELDFAITHSSDRFVILDAYDALQTTLLQNGRWDQAISGLEPVFVKGEEVVFSQQGENPFEGGNSWRFADLKSLQYISQGLDRIEEGRLHTHMHLETDELRTYAFHQARTDLNGAYVVSNERQDDHTGGDYVMAHFSLACFDPYPDQDVYVFGQCSDWMFPLTHRMEWNDQSRRYELALFLKQGYYNYAYLTRPKWAANRHDSEALTEGAARTSTIEGSHAAADNSYQIIAYYWDDSGYDRVIGFQPGRSAVY
tara:strand:+ start:2159 stop:3418 length:1260 start_codon:yes stop_codon:yes gene_type:complete